MVTFGIESLDVSSSSSSSPPEWVNQSELRSEIAGGYIIALKGRRGVD